MILQFTQWLQFTAMFTALRESWYVYPVVMSTHLLLIAIGGGMVLITNLRLLGWIMRDRPVSDVIDKLRTQKRIALIIIVICGFLMFGSKAEEYYYNIFFKLKLILLALMFLHGWIFRRSVYYNTAQLDESGVTPTAKLAAALSLLIWISIACAGRGIGYVDAPLDKIHAMLFPSGIPRF